MGKIGKFTKHIFDTWIRPKDEPTKPKGELYVTTPDGKTTITVDITNSRDAAKAKQLVNLALSNDCGSIVDYGLTD